MIFNCQKWGNKNSKNHQIFIFDFQCGAGAYFALLQYLDFFSHKLYDFLREILPKFEIYITNFDNNFVIFRNIEKNKVFYFQRKTSVKENLLEYVGRFYFQHGMLNLQCYYHLRGKATNSRQKWKREESSLLTAFCFNWILFAKKRNSNQNLKNEVIPEGFQFARSEGKKRVKNSQISIFGFQCVAKRLINHVYFISGL